MGRALSLKYTKYGVLGGSLVVPGIALPATHPGPPHPGYTPATPSSAAPSATRVHGGAGRLNMVVGLKSVQQLSLSARFSDIRGMTEDYNLLRIDNR